MLPQRCLDSKKREDSVMETTVRLMGEPKDLDLLVRVERKVKIKDLKDEDVERRITRTKTICGYNKATEGTIDNTIQFETP